MDRRVEAQTAGDLPARLPEDVLADILRRLAPRDLAASRCVRKVWRDVVDTHRLLRAYLLPHWVGGIFINFSSYLISEFLSRPSASRPAITGKHDYLPDPGFKSWSRVYDHCNGLLLVDGYDHVLRRRVDYVLNPATRWCAPLPPLSDEQPNYSDPYSNIYDKYLVYDPSISLNYKVFAIPRFTPQYGPIVHYHKTFMEKLNPAIEQSEWPPFLFTLHVFSSRTGQWEERSFVREGDAAGTVRDMRLGSFEICYAVYWRGALYVHCQTDFFMRISLSNRKYQVIKRPTGVNEAGIYRIHLGKSKNGVYCANFHTQFCLRIWILEESSNQVEWVLKHDMDLRWCLFKHNLGGFCWGSWRQVGGPWILQDINCHYAEGENDTLEQPEQDNFEWSSEMSADENTPLDNDHEYTETQRYTHDVDILGFHPFKEIIFLSQSIVRGLAYDFNSSNVKVLGGLYPSRYHEERDTEQSIMSSFPYTPCWLGQAGDENNSDGHLNS